MTHPVGLFDEFPVLEGGKDDDAAGQILADDGFGGGHAVKDRHSDVHKDHIGVMAAAEFDGIEAVGGIAQDREGHFLQHLAEVHTGDRFIIDDDGGGAG